MKKLISILLTVSILSAVLSVSICAVNIELTTTEFTINNETLLLNTDTLESVTNITMEEAVYIARFFVDDMILLDNCAWNENTEIVDVVTMYDETGTSPTAYTIELSSGYIVVSAFADAESLIPEWSDAETPVYDSLSNANKIIYLGSLSYFAEIDDMTVVDQFGNDIERNELINYIELSRNISNLSDESIEICSVVIPDIPPSIPIIQIEDPYAEARRVYNDTFVCVDYCNLWDDGVNYDYIEYFKGGDIINTSRYNGYCVPVCITNIIIAHSKKYNIPLSSYDSSINNYNDLFEYVAEVGIEYNYYLYDSENNCYRGVNPSNVGAYLYRVFNRLSISANCVSNIIPTYDNIYNHLNNGSLLALRLYNHHAYSSLNDSSPGGHRVLCFAYVRLRGQTTGYYKTYLKIADGWNGSARFIDLSTVVDYVDGEYVFDGHSNYVRVTFTN